MNDYRSVLRYIEEYWKKTTCFSPENNQTHIGLPHHFVSPNETYFRNDQFYWDSYFIALGLLSQPTKNNVRLVKGIIENFAYLQRTYGIIPLRNKLYNLGISQPPFLSTLVLDVYEHTQDLLWIKEMSVVIANELEEYWKSPHHFISGLSRYCDHEITHVTAEHESGWDMTSRFSNECLHYLPIDLNCLLYRYEKDLARIHTILEQRKQANHYEEQARNRQQLINKLCWNEEQGFYYDYHHKEQRQSNFSSLAGYYALWSGLASTEQARKMVNKLTVFEHDGGLANTQQNDLSNEFKQWDHPNGWPNQQWIVIKGLIDYGYTEDAQRLAHKWLELNKQVFKQTGVLWEKYDVVACTSGKDGRYPTQTGFGWTNGVFVRLVKEFYPEQL